MFNRNKNGQLHLTETVAILFIFFVLILFGLIFYFQYQKSAVKEKQEELLALRAMDVTLRTLFLPELLCSKGEAEIEGNCFDLMKLRSLTAVLDRHYDDYYYDLFGYSKISVYQLYPVTEGLTTEWIIYDHPKPEFISSEPTYYLLSLRDDTLDQYGFGYVKVEVYS